MRTRLNVYLGPDAEWLKANLKMLADEVITDEEAGQRGEKVSVLIRMIAAAPSVDFGATVEHLKAIKAIFAHPAGED